MTPGVQFSRRMAIAAGVVLPLVETLRRWDQLSDFSVWPFWLDDFAIGGVLLLSRRPSSRLRASAQYASLARYAPYALWR